MIEPELILDDTPGREAMEFVGERLVAFNRSAAGVDGHNWANFYLRSDTGAIVGGVIASTFWNWLHVEVLWVDEQYRQQGLGQRLLDAVEQEAVRRGCTNSFLDTFSFQAPVFYQKRGYVVFGELPDFPKGQTRYFMKKPLQHISQAE